MNKLIAFTVFALSLSAHANVKSDCEYKAIAKAIGYATVQNFANPKRPQDYNFDHISWTGTTEDGPHTTVVDVQIQYNDGLGSDGLGTVIQRQISVPRSEAGGRCLIGNPTDVTNND